MAVKALGCKVRSLERKTALPVNICYVFNDPGTERMAPGTVRSHGLVVHIGMTTETVRFCISKNKGWMAQLAIHRSVLPLQGKFGCIMIK
jgi:hypothetical protein